MKRWMTVAILAVFTTLTVAVGKPAPAEADTGEVLIWTGVGTGVAIVIVLIATYFTRDEDAMFLAEPPPDPNHADESRVHFGKECKNPDGTAALLCW